MQEKPTSFDIAQLAGVSQPTVSRALRGSPTVSEATRRKIEEIARQLNYKVDKNASNLRSQHTNTLALLLFEDPTPDDSLINPFFLSMLGSITRNCAIRGYDLLVSFQQLSGNWHTDYQDSGKADGVILLGYGDYDEYRWRLDKLVAEGANFVRWGSVQEGQPGITIGCDNLQGGYEITRHLIGLGRRRIAFLGAASSGYPEFQDRYRGYVKALSEAELPVLAANQVDAISTEESGHEAALTLIGRGLDFDAVVCASDLIAIGAIRALQEHGLAVPDTVAVTGFDDILAANFANPPLTTIAQDSREAGAALVDALIGQIGKQTVESRMLPTRLVVRRSCGGAPT
ncbi:LacI family DNA-binding transcriptional regulator [Phenylobacterium montanum]|uniref:LacI family DNA-binding transcriptional regulator n=1 Tax=Phenylobacterium montanum TaxID=2823693 RepID=A0A975G2L8_9CAUL|nr:LacI family DNA-binding transcriptional regulator [Caulobacter sp. S6]QUD89407.1 LacI family DNA-binding transcriptional regulator [Caulobacter sp. S6]